ncbi:Uncharacterised protein [Mycobacteroides abscessus subsp. abscessus]|nr:Uncharacterised protein [Mycobacteroides abscessus subsp. abscessus]
MAFSAVARSSMGSLKVMMIGCATPTVSPSAMLMFGGAKLACGVGSVTADADPESRPGKSGSAWAGATITAPAAAIAADKRTPRRSRRVSRSCVGIGLSFEAACIGFSSIPSPARTQRARHFIGV